MHYRLVRLIKLIKTCRWLRELEWQDIVRFKTMVGQGIDYPDSRHARGAGYSDTRCWKLASSSSFHLFRCKTFLRRLAGRQPSVQPTTRGVRVIVSLTTIPQRIHLTHLVVESLMRQTLPPDEIILSIPADAPVPERLRRLQKGGRGVTIVPQLPGLDRHPHNKLLVALARDPEACIATADDDLLYPRKWLEHLYNAWLAAPEKIICHSANHIRKISDDRLAPYSEWSLGSPLFDANLLPRGCMGVLYFPRSLHKDVSDGKKIRQLCPKADDIWFRAMSLLNGVDVKYTAIYDHAGFVPIPHDFRRSLYYSNRKPVGGNDDQAEQVFSHYKLHRLLEPHDH